MIVEFEFLRYRKAKAMEALLILLVFVGAVVATCGYLHLQNRA